MNRHEQERVNAWLNALADREREIDAPDRVGRSLLAAFEEQMGAPARAKSGKGWYWLAAAAAAAIIFTALTVAVWRGPRQTARETPVVEVTPPRQEAIVAQSPHDSAATASPVQKRAAKRAKAATRVSNENEDEGELISLNPAISTGADLGEFEYVVRMHIPHTTLALWGLPVREDLIGRQIDAEVTFGENGVARAIRILN